MRRACLIGLVFATLVGCGEGARYDQAICALIDISGTYADQKEDAVRILKREVLPAMVPGDTLIVVRIDGDSYSKENIEALVTLDARPSRANAQKLELARILDSFAARDDVAAHTDIPGAMMLGAEYLGELASPSRVMLVFSDMAEDLPAGTHREIGDDEFTGVSVVAMNVKRLRPDNADPGRFRARLRSWENRVRGSGAAAWLTLHDDARLGPYLEETR